MHNSGALGDDTVVGGLAASPLVLRSLLLLGNGNNGLDGGSSGLEDREHCGKSCEVSERRGEMGRVRNSVVKRIREMWMMRRGP